MDGTTDVRPGLQMNELATEIADALEESGRTAGSGAEARPAARG